MVTLRGWLIAFEPLPDDEWRDDVLETQNLLEFVRTDFSNEVRIYEEHKCGQFTAISFFDFRNHGSVLTAKIQAFAIRLKELHTDFVSYSVVYSDAELDEVRHIHSPDAYDFLRVETEG